MARRKPRKRKEGGGGRGGGGGWFANLLLFAILALVVVFAASAAWRMVRPAWRFRLEAPKRGQRHDDGRLAGIEARGRMRLEVWNGSGIAGAGQRVAEALRDGGFRVVDVRNADRSDYGKTLVVDRKGNPRAVREVVEYFHGGYPLLMRSATAAADVRVVVGRDHEGLRLNP